MSVDKEDLTPFNIPVTIPEAHLSLPQGLDLRPQQGDSGLVSLLNEVVMKCLSVLANHFFAHLSTPCTEHSRNQIRSTKYEPNSNAQNSNDLNELKKSLEKS
jgi:hypothetical protein